MLERQVTSSDTKYDHLGVGLSAKPDSFTLHLYAALVEKEDRPIDERTRAALLQRSYAAKSK